MGPSLAVLIAASTWLACDSAQAPSQAEPGPAVDPVAERFADVVEDRRGVEVRAAADWSELFRRRAGWTGADGIYAMPFDGVQVPGRAQPIRTLFTFGDTIIGRVDPETGARVEGWVRVHYSAAVLDGARPDPQRIRFVLPGVTPGAEMLPLRLGTPEKLRYWLQDGFLHGGRYTTLAMGVRRSADYPWWTRGTVLLSAPLGEDGPVWSELRQGAGRYARLEGGEVLVYFGAAVLEYTSDAGWPTPDGWVYVYGRWERAMRPFDPWTQRIELVVARVRPGAFRDASAWRYWTGRSWSDDIARVAPLGLGGPELSVTPIGCGPFAGKFLLVSKHVATDLYYRVGDTPYGPFGPPARFYRTAEHERYGPGVHTYNAKAHPHLSPPGWLLVSYNANDPERLGADADVYRPRFLWLGHGAGAACAVSPPAR